MSRLAQVEVERLAQVLHRSAEHSRPDGRPRPRLVSRRVTATPLLPRAKSRASSFS